MMTSRRSGVLVIGDTHAFSLVIQAMLEPGLVGWGPVTATTYEDCRGLLSPRVLRETVLFIVELWRSYATGLRAEGVAVAEQLMRIGSTPLIVSPLSLGGSLAISCYWDLASKDNLVERCVTTLQSRMSGSPTPDESIKFLKQLFHEHLAKPVGHDEFTAPLEG